MATVEVPVTEIKSVNEEDFINAQKVFQTGKKNLFLNKYDESVNNIGDACKTYSAKFGEMSEQCGEIYYFYGRALLELARVENTVLGNALNGVPEDDSPIDDSRYGNPDDVAEEEQKDITEKVIDALCEERKPEEKTNTETPTAETKTETETPAMETETPTTEAKTETPAPATETKTETPATETKTETPAAETKTETTSVEETKTETPATETKTETPATETKTEAPATEAKSETTSVEETKTETPPVEENKTETPVVEAMVTESPAEEAKTETKAEEAKTETKAEESPAAEKKEGETGEEEAEEEGVEEEDEEEVEAETEEQAKDEAEAEEISNLQRAWEMFELAKLVYTKHFNNDLAFKNKRIAECLLKLGEISIEQEVYEQAISDITESIRIQEEQKEERDERMLAESFYQLGLCQQFNNMFKESNDTYQKSINIMQLRIEKLKGKIELIKDNAEQEAERNTMTDEITELEALLPEMMSKLEEVNEQGEKSLSLIKEAKEMMMNTMASTEATKPVGGEVKDITNMVKSKRKIDSSEDTTGVKKTRLSENGDGLTPAETTENSEPAMETETKAVEEKKIEPEAATEPMVEAAEPITV